MEFRAINNILDGSQVSWNDLTQLATLQQPGRVTHSFHQNQLGAVDQSAVDPGCLLSEHADTLLQSALLHLRRHVVFQAVKSLSFLFGRKNRQLKSSLFSSRGVCILAEERCYLPHAVGEQEAHAEAHLPDEGQRLLVVLLCLTAEA